VRTTSSLKGNQTNLCTTAAKRSLAYVKNIRINQSHRNFAAAEPRTSPLKKQKDGNGGRVLKIEKQP
jgi:hypothetical protein